MIEVLATILFVIILIRAVGLGSLLALGAMLLALAMVV